MPSNNRVFIHADQPILTVSKQIFGCKNPPLFVSVSEMRFIVSTVLNDDKHVIKMLWSNSDHNKQLVKSSTTSV